MPAKDASETTAKAKTAYEGTATTTISLPRARVVRGIAYGPGDGIKVPQSVADAIQAENKQASKGVQQGKGLKRSE